MPVVHSVVSEANTHIHLPMITQVAHHLVNSLNLPQYIKNDIHIETGWTSTKGTRDDHSLRIRGNMFRVMATQASPHAPVFDYQTFNHVGGHTFYPGQLDIAYNPILRDPYSEVSLHEVPLPCSFTLDCTFWMIDRNLAYDIIKRLALRFSNGVVHSLSMVYDYPVPKDIISMLFGLFKFRKFSETDDRFGEIIRAKKELTFADWLDKTSIVNFVMAKSRARNTSELVINKHIDNALLSVEFEGGKPEEDKNMTVANTYQTNFTCRFQFAEAAALILKYPCIVDNTIVPANMIPQPRANDTPIRSMKPAFQNPMLDDAFNELRAVKDVDEPVVCPYYDDWIVPENELWHRSYRPFFISIYTIEPEKLNTTIDLSGVLYEDSKLHDIVQYILKAQGNESFRDDCIFNISAYLRDRRQLNSEMSLSPELMLTLKAQNIHPQRHLVISEITDYRYLNPKWWKYIEQFPDYFKPHTKPGGNNSGDNNGTNRAFRIFNYALIPRNTGIREQKS